MKKPRKKILVIDDDLGMIKVLEKRLQSDGYDVLGALKGTMGITMAQTEAPDLILLDVKIPDMSGGEIARVLKGDPRTKNIPIVFITVTISKKDDKISREFEIDGTLYPAFAKPLYNPKLLSTIRKLIRNPNHNFHAFKDVKLNTPAEEKKNNKPDTSL